ncbi:hypothetical protein KAFR_0A07050 [Kazachstania africana CBS 2517]|uniref:Uncharacterized protein n=1 Tax=Kazachstania africana (strain ATCC 22294 / BCRC 22015 / CBS 2517 / CECT 1963 / NBRC 1671 / NRRL Y-8276) TaxID=1071382 RepID=H2AP39_KAZAF|nr:hypothetical protein KAFR_0A07050 [Kazachstania africana CBS 2517]CCF56139.1 hypothetical protein KAFR_0A07050 [Kazachstania africana CBS 2517]
MTYLPTHLPINTTILTFIHRVSRGQVLHLTHLRSTPSRSLIPTEKCQSEYIMKKSGLYYYITRDSVPTFILKKHEISDPIQFYESVTDLGKRYGCIKLKFTSEESNAVDMVTKLDINFEKFWFKARKQYLKPLKNENARILKFYRNLYHYYTSIKKSTNFIKIPSIDKRTLDLYRLRKCVHLRGGFDAVCQKKLWAQIGRELGYSGRIMSSLSTSLRSAYEKVLLEFDLYEDSHNDGNVTNNLEPKSPANLTPPLEEPIAHNELKRKSYEQNDTHFKRHNLGRTISTQLSCELGGIEDTFFRIRDVKKSKKFPTKFESLTEERIGYTQSNRATLPSYDFNFWETGLEIYDNDKFESKSSPLYNIKQYYEKSQTVFQKVKEEYPDKFSDLLASESNLSLENFEDLYWQLLSNQDNDLEIDSGLAVSSRIHGDDLALPPYHGLNGHNMLNKWRLKDLPLNENSLAKFMDIDLGGHTISRYDIGMLFSILGWSVNDNFVPSINFNHLGSSKVWYIVSEPDMEKFENLLDKNCQQNPEIHNEIYEEAFERSEFFKCYKENSFYGDASISDNVELKSSHSLNNLQLHPDMILSNGIKLRKVIQEAGSFIFKFPKCYTSSISSGFHVSETAHFMPKSWSQYAIDGTNWLAQNRILPSIDLHKFLMNLLLYSEDQDIINYCERFLRNYIQNELQNRMKIKKLLNNIDIIHNCLDFTSTSSLKSTGFSKVVLSHDADIINLSLEEFFDFFKGQSDFLNPDQVHIFNKPLSLFQISLHVRYEDKMLQNILDSVYNARLHANVLAFSSSDVASRLEKLVNSKYEDRAIPLEVLQKMLQETNARDPAYKALNELVLKSQLLRRDCQNILTVLKRLQDNHKPNVPVMSTLQVELLEKSPLSLLSYKLFSCIKKVQEYPVTFEELPRLVKLHNETIELEKKIYGLRNASTTLDELLKLYDMLFFLPIMDEPQNELLIHIHKSIWLKLFEDVFISDDHKSPYSIDELYSFFDFGVKYCGSSEIDKLEIVRSRIIMIQNVVQRVKKIMRNVKLNAKLSISDVKEVSSIIQTQHVPIDENVKKLLDDILNGVESIRSSMNPLWDKLSINRPFIDEIDDLIRKNSTDYFKLSSKFNGSESDKRICITEARENDMLTKQVKTCRSWIFDFNKIVKKHKLDKLLPTVSRCLDLETDACISYEDPNTIQTSYCFCRQGDVGTMVECELCKEWYHTTCINKGNWSLPDDPRSAFVCSICNINLNTAIPPQNKINFGNLKSIVIDSLKLEVIPERKILQNLFELFHLALTFRNELETVLFENGEINTKNSLHKIKFYIRKAEGSFCEFIDLLGPLKRYCHHVDREKFANLQNSGSIIVTGNE